VDKSKPNMAHLNAMNAKKHPNPLNFTKSTSTNSKKAMLTNMKHAINPYATCSLDFMSQISQIPECTNTSNDAKEVCYILTLDSQGVVIFRGLMAISHPAHINYFTGQTLLPQVKSYTGNLYAINRLIFKGDNSGSLCLCPCIWKLPILGTGLNSHVQDKKGMNKDHSGFDGSPKAERQALVVVQHGHNNMDVTPPVPKHGDTSTKVLGAKFPSALPPIKNGRNNSTRLQQDPPANVVSKNQRLQNPKVLKHL
jgi:hypothetical protein